MILSLSLSSVGFPRPPLNAPFSPLPSTSLSSLSFSFVRARAPVSRLLSESSKVKQSETLSGVERTFNNATKARIRGCLLCHAIATGDGTWWGGRFWRGKGTGCVVNGGKKRREERRGKIMTERKTCEGGVVIRVTSINWSFWLEFIVGDLLWKLFLIYISFLFFN